MNRLLLVSLLLTTKLFAASEPLTCDVGAVSKTYGETAWTVSSCSDGKSLVVVSAPGNPAMPFYFMITYVDGVRSMYGEGNGSKEASTAAGDELSELIESDIAVDALVAVVGSRVSHK